LLLWTTETAQQRASACESGLHILSACRKTMWWPQQKVCCSRVTAARRRRPSARCPVLGGRLGGRLGAASLPRIARKKLVATGGFEPASSKTSRRRYQLDYETQIRYIVPHILHSAPPLHQHLRPCRHHGKHLICRSPALRCLPEMGGWLLAADGCWLTATASCCLLTAGCWQRTATRCSSTKPQTHLCR